MIENLVEINMPENFVWVQWVTRAVLIITWLVAMIVASHSKRMMLFTAIPILTPFAIIYMLIKRISGAIYPASLLGLAALCFYGGTNVVVEADKSKLRKELSEFWTNNTRFSTAAKNFPESSEDNIWEHPYLKTIALAAGTNSIAAEARQQLDQKYGNMRIGKPKLEFDYELPLPEDDIKQASALTPFRSLHSAAIALKEKEDSKPSITNLPASVEDSVEILGSFFKSVEPSCNDLQEAISRPVDEFPYQWKEGLNMLLPNLSQIKAFTELFSLRSIYQLTRKEPKLGFDDSLFAFRLGHVSESNITISRLVQIANTLKALETLVGAETLHLWSNEQLFAIHKTISEIKPLDWLPNMGSV